LLFYVVLV